MKIRLAVPADALAIAALHASSWASTYGGVPRPECLRDRAPQERRALWQARFENPSDNQVVLAALDDGERLLALACVFTLQHPEWGSYLDNLHVRPAHRGGGAGAALLIEVAAACERRERGHGLYLLVNQANEGAQRFYRRYGARYAEDSVWNAPDGSVVPTFRFAWPSTAEIVAR